MIYFSTLPKQCFCTTLQNMQTQKLRTRSTFAKSVIVSVSVSKMGVAGLFFVKPGVKVNGKYYRDVLLS